MIDWFINQDILIKTILAGLFTFLLTGMGASIVFLFKKVNKLFMDACLSLSGGIMLAASFWSLLEPSINLSKSLNLTSWLITLLGILAGGLLLYISDGIYDIYEHKKEKSNMKRIFMLIFSITMHNIPEGLAVGVAFGSLKYGIPGATILAAISLTVGIGIQNFPEGSAVSLPLRREGYSRLKAFLIGSLTGIVEPISALLGALLILKIKYLLPFLLALAGGAMLYVIFKEIIPESQKNEKPELMCLISLIGFCIMMVLDITL